jgi:hypothetical protein
MRQSAKELRQRVHWEWMKEQGHIPYVLQCILTWLGSSALVDLAHFLCFKLGWLSSPTSTSIVDLLVTGVLAGGSFGQMHWSDMKRKFDTLPPGEDWTMK